MNSVTPETLKSEAEESKTIGFIDFAQHITSNVGGLFCFFEGRDVDYYYSRIESVYKGKIQSIRCGSKEIIDGKEIRCSAKKNVIRTNKLIAGKPMYARYKTVYFVDRDFEQPVPQDDIYTTPCYAIENLYTSPEVFERILKHKFGVQETKPEFAICKNMYRDRQQEFHSAMTLFNAWYACLIDIRSSTGQETGATLGDSKIEEKGLSTNGLVRIYLDRVKNTNNIDEIKAKFPKAPSISSDVLDSKIAEFNASAEKGKLFRGKFELQFLAKILNLLQDDASKEKRYLKVKVSLTNINAESLLLSLATYAETPADLLTYIRTRV